MRIISGYLKGRTFDPPRNFKARPTTDFAKENLFNCLSNWIDWEDTEALDIFGGTGSISYELVSRGCKSVVCIEKYAKYADFIKQKKKELKLDNLLVLNQDFFRFIKKEYPRQFDFIFVDPPYNLEDFDTIPKLILESNLLKDGAFFVIEHSKTYDFSDLPYFKEKRVYGSVNFSIFIYQKNAN